MVVGYFMAFDENEIPYSLHSIGYDDYGELYDYHGPQTMLYFKNNKLVIGYGREGIEPEDYLEVGKSHQGETFVNITPNDNFTVKARLSTEELVDIQLNTYYSSTTFAYFYFEFGSAPQSIKRLKIGTTTVGKVKIGANTISKVYVGGKLVYYLAPEPEPTPPDPSLQLVKDLASLDGTETLVIYNANEGKYVGADSGTSTTTINVYTTTVDDALKYTCSDGKTLITKINTSRMFRELTMGESMNIYGSATASVMNSRSCVINEHYTLVFNKSTEKMMLTTGKSSSYLIGESVTADQNTGVYVYKVVS